MSVAGPRGAAGRPATVLDSGESLPPSAVPRPTAAQDFRGPAPALAGRGWRSVTTGPGAAVLVAGALAALIAACGRGSPHSDPAPAAACFVLEGTESDGDGGAGIGTRPSPIFGLTHAVDPENAPVPRNPGEDFVFGSLYEPLIRMDCTGKVIPGLAAGWAEEDGGRRWTFTLREGARFWNGEPVTARDVARGWQQEEGRGRDPWGSVRPLAVEVLDDRRLRVTLSRPWSHPPPVLTTAELAVTRPTNGTTWPRAGTGPYRPADPSTRVGAGAGDGGDLLLERVSPDPTSNLPAGIRIRIDPGADPRDLLDAGVDLLFTGDPETLEYADLRPGLSTRALPWSRRYLLVLAASLPAGDAASAPPAGFLEGLARDVAQEEARPASGAGCLMDPWPASRSAGGGSRLGYPGSDRTARALAERLVALATASPPRDGMTALSSSGIFSFGIFSFGISPRSDGFFSFGFFQNIVPASTYFLYIYQLKLSRFAILKLHPDLERLHHFLSCTVVYSVPVFDEYCHR